MCVDGEVIQVLGDGPVHYRNGRDALNGDKVVQIGDKGIVVAAGVLFNATPGNDYCNGWVVPVGSSGAPGGDGIGACLCDCLHVDDLADLLKHAGLDKRPAGK